MSYYKWQVGVNLPFPMATTQVSTWTGVAEDLLESPRISWFPGECHVLQWNDWNVAIWNRKMMALVNSMAISGT